MSPRKIHDLVDDTFDNGTVHLKFLEKLIQHIVKKSNLEDDDVEESEIECKKFVDPIAKLIPETENKMTNLVDVLNITKRIESLEISVQKISSVVRTIIDKSKRSEFIDDEVPEIKLEEQTISSEMSCKIIMSNSSSISSVAKINECDRKILAIEHQLRAFNESVNQNQYIIRNKICDIEEKVHKTDEKLKDIFYACEQNDEKIDEAILSLDDFKTKTFCLKSDVKMLMEELVNSNEKIATLSDTCEHLKSSKADLSHVQDVLRDEFERMSSKLNCLNKLEEENESLKAEMKKFSICLKRFNADMQEAQSQIDEKLEKKEVRRLKENLARQFDNFVNELKILLRENSKNGIAKGTTEGLKCISCDNNVSMNKQLEMTSKHATPKTVMMSEPEIVPDDEKIFSCTSNVSMINFPSTSEQCFIISRDNTIFKADPLKCLLSPKYTINKL